MEKMGEHKYAPQLSKDTTYAHQKEVRILWTTTNRPIEPVIVKSMLAARYCKRAI